MRRALAIHEQVQGAEHPDTAIALVNLANVLDRESRSADAIALRRRALSIFEQKLGPDHPLVAATLGQIARQLLVDHHPRDAAPLLERALAIGDAHHAPDDAYTLSLLGSAQLDGGDPKKAVATLERALAALSGPDADADLASDVRFNLADALW